MTVLPAPIIPELVQRYTGVNGPANLVVLAPRSVSGFGPEAVMGSANLPDKISPYSGIYDEKGRLPSIPPPGTIFMAKV
jgi:hypothetical protein